MSHVVRVNPIDCRAHGMCAELLPEMIQLDPWGYPILEGRPVPPEILGHARRAAYADASGHAGPAQTDHKEICGIVPMLHVGRRETERRLDVQSPLGAVELAARHLSLLPS